MLYCNGMSKHPLAKSRYHVVIAFGHFGGKV
jgi:hypothetical protein